MTEKDDDKRRDEVDPDAPPSAEEVAASKRLRDALEDPSIHDPDADFARALHAAFDPNAIEGGEHDLLVDDVASPEEIELARELREALESSKTSHEMGGLAVALHAAWAPTPISEADHRAIVAKALEAATGTKAKVVDLREAREKKVASMARPQRGRTVLVVTGVLALAASVFLYLKSTPQIGGPTASAVPLAHMRSTQPLFHEPFKAGEPTTKDTASRIDRIAMARSGDLRNNRFAKWGVR